VVATGTNRVGRTNVERLAPIATFSTGAVTGAMARASETVSTSGLAVAIAEGALLMTPVGALLITAVGALWMTVAAGCTAVKRHGAMGMMICSGGWGVLPDAGDVGGAVGGAAGVPEL
jgi:hypothetical protein